MKGDSHHGSSFFRISPQALDHPVLDHPLADRCLPDPESYFPCGACRYTAGALRTDPAPGLLVRHCVFFLADQHRILSGIFSGAFHRISGVPFSHRGRILRAAGAAHEDGSRRVLRDPGADLDRL